MSYWDNFEEVSPSDYWGQFEETETQSPSALAETPGQRAWNSIKHDLEDMGYGIKKGLSGATFGASDWALRKLGFTDDDYLARREAEGLGGAVKLAGMGAELGGNMLGAGGGLVKALAGKGLKGLKLGMASGGIEGLATGATSSDTLSELPKNVALGGIIGTGGGMLGEGLTYLARPFSARSLTKGMKGGLDNVVENPEAVKLLNQGIKQSDDVASEFLLKSRPVARGINKETANMVDSALTSRVDIPEAIRSANEKYGKYMDEHGADQIYSMLSPEEQKAANFAKFFEGSKVVDEKGNPLPYYHGSLRKFDEFKQHNGDYNFAPDKEFAYDYAVNKGFEQGIDDDPQLYSVFINSKNPFDFENPQHIETLKKALKGKKTTRYGNDIEEEDFINNIKGYVNNSDLNKGEFEKLKEPWYKWYSPNNKKVDYEGGSVSTHRIIDTDENGFIAGYGGYDFGMNDVVDTVKSKLKDVKWNGNKGSVEIDVPTWDGKTRTHRIDLLKVNKYDPNNLKKADNWFYLEGSSVDGKNLTNFIKDLGFDGYYKTEKGIKNLSVFNPNQIKSVNNSGAWSSSPSLSDAGWTPEPYIGSLYEGLNPFQAKSLKGAIVRGGEKLEKGAKLGSVDHFNKIKQDINSQISDLVVRKGKEGDVRLLEILKSSVDNKAPKELKVVDKIYEKAKRLENAFDRGTHYNPNNVEGADYISELSPLEQNAFAQGLFKRINNNSLTGKNLANTALGYENTLASVLRGDKYDDLMKGLNKQSTKFERLAGLGRKAESKLNTPEAQRFFGREQLESKGSMIGSALDWLNTKFRHDALERAGKNLLNPNYVGDSEAWLIENYPIIAGYLSSKLNQEVNQ